MVTFRNKHDVLTALIHLGYLAYDQNEGTAFIPNEDVRIEFAEALEEAKRNEDDKKSRKHQCVIEKSHKGPEKGAGRTFDEK